MKIGKLELKQEKLIIALVAIFAAIVLVIYLVFYAPLMKDLNLKYQECKRIENDVIQTRNVIKIAGKIYSERVLVTEKETHYAIKELTTHGSSKGINFISINPKDVKAEKGTSYKVMTVEMEIESTYQQLAEFMGSLDDLKKGLIRVKSFDIVADEENPSKLQTDLTIDMYLSVR
ncbi:MAG: type 4a pilus biogenesis protein PilO [Candidatus Omnitrophica bacterium]|nr:type 4a pilus biogenesis protein PilO [Candidatus Omnitrophota bacterium]